MKFKDLYSKGLDRKVNPAVSASDLTEDTVMTEIVEYVFTEEIIVYLYEILLNIRQNQGSHVGIWINGYFGTGKSHFLKYVSYCLNARYSELAFMRLEEAVEEIIRSSTGMTALDDHGVSLSEIRSLQRWYTKEADVQMVMFNIGDVHDVNSDQTQAFTTIFWNQFNAQRGYNSFNLALAQYLEKALDDDGKFGEFKSYLQSKGYDWERNISRFATGRLDMALQMAKVVDPALAIDVIRTKIQNNDINVSVESFAVEMKEYIDSRHNPNFRLLFFVDEVSQFIGEHRGLLLQLQSLVKRLEEICESRVWIACTAQQTLEEVVSHVGGSTTNPEDEVGKILGRFEVRASLQGTSPEYITQKRILDKKGEAEVMLAGMYEKDKAKIDAQFVLPSTYRAYRDKDDFAAYYPFVPYQFQLIKKVLDAFESMDYVDKQVKGNERSLINITFSIAKETEDMEVGEYIPFDKFFGAMVQGSMQHMGQRAFENARQALESLQDEKKEAFYRRVVYVLFMICNLKEEDKQQFSATIDNVVTLLMSKVDAGKAALKQEVSAVLAYLIDKAVIRKVKTDTGNEVYEFFSEEESKVARIIRNQQVDSNTYNEELKKIFFAHFGQPSNKVQFASRSFTVGISIDGRNYLSNNAEVQVDFVTTASTDSPDQYAFSLSNSPQGSHLMFFLYPLFKDSQELRANFLYYCRVQRFAQEPAISEERQHTKAIFEQRANELYDKEIVPQFQQMLDTCPVISCASLLSSSETGTVRRTERYKTLLTKHIEKLYPFAKLADNKEVPRTHTELSARILRPVEELDTKPLSVAEEKVRNWLDRQPHDVTVADAVRQFARVPYGWSDFATIYFLNELVRRHLYAYSYMGDPNVSREDTARNIVRDAAKFTVGRAKAIPQELLNEFIGAWKHIFNVVNVKGSNDSTELYRSCKETDDSALNQLLRNYRELSRKISGYPFIHSIDEAVTLMEQWQIIRDPQKFFGTIIAAKDDAASLFDRCKYINMFCNEQFDRYSQVRKFIEDNRDNFDFIPAEGHEAVTALKVILTDKEPWTKMPAYIKMKKSIEVQLHQKRSELEENVRVRYSAVFDELERYAEDMHVSRDKFARRDITILRKTASGNFYALQAAADTSAFYEEQMHLINQAVDESQKRKTKVVKLRTHTAEPMRSEDDVDRYLQSLKEQLMPYINENNDIIVS